MRFIYSTVLLGLTVTYAAMGQDEDYNRIKPQRHQGVSLIHKLDRQKLKEGENLMVTESNGIRLYAIVKNGKLTGWRATDRKGSEVRTQIVHHPDSDSDARPMRCWVCVDVGSLMRCHRTVCDSLEPAL